MHLAETWKVLVPVAMALIVAGCERAPSDNQSIANEASFTLPEDPTRAVRAEFEAALLRAYPVDAPKATATTTIELRAAPAEVPQFDGRPLSVWAYNGQVPGPILRVRHGHELEVRFENQLPQPTTIHWHGVRVPNAMDGVPGVTQDPIERGGRFTYRFTPKDAGTFWFHPHVRTSEQVERGLYGVLIVDDAEPLPYNRDEVWVLDDWRLGADGEVDPRFVTRHDLAHDGRWGQAITVNGDSEQVLEVRPGARVRLRLANTSNGRVFRPDFSALDAKIIAMDGMYTAVPLAVAQIELAPGNRADLDITLPHEPAVFTITDRFTRRPFTLATIRASGEPVETPAFAPPSNPEVPTWEGVSEIPVDFTYELNARRGGGHGIQWTLNDKVWGEHNATQLPAGRWVKLRFANLSSRLHPMHIHGQFFRVLTRNGKPVDEPHFRDTVLLHPRETIDVGMVPIDWGRWMMHCHILEHAEAGMMTEVVVSGEPTARGSVRERLGRSRE